MGYEAGCNDYVRKPFNFEELEIRMHQLLHKCSTKKVKINHRYSFDLGTMNLYFKEQSINLSAHEKSLLYILIKNINTIVHPSVIKDYVWDEKDVCDNTLRTQIKKIRTKIEDNFILNIRNMGYKITQND